MKLNDVRRFSAYVSTIYHSKYITISSLEEMISSDFMFKVIIFAYFGLKVGLMEQFS